MKQRSHLTLPGFDSPDEIYHTGSIQHRPRSEQRILIADLTGDNHDLAEAALEKYYDDYYGPLVALARRCLHAMPDSGLMTPEDLAQTAFTELWARRKTFKALHNVYSYLEKVVRTRSQNAVRDATNHVRKMEHVTSRMDTITHSTPADVMDSKENCQRIRQALQWALPKMTPAQREAFVRRHLQDESYEDIADDLGIPVGTVKSRCNAARATLRILLGFKLDLDIIS